MTALVRLHRTGKEIPLAVASLGDDPSRELASLAEAAGLQPKFGCRGGLCHECTCTKLSGQVVDVRTGKPSRLDQEEIQVCIAVPQGTVEIVL